MALKKAFDGEVFYWYDDDRGRGTDVTPTTPPDFTEQARQLVEQIAVDYELHGISRQEMTRRIASFASEAATVALEQAKKRVENLTHYRLDFDDCDIVSDGGGDYLMEVDVIAAMGDDKEQR